MKKLALILVLCASPALAQQPTPEMEAMGAKLMQEINSGIQCNANAVAWRREIDRLTAEVKALKEKYEPAKAEEKK